jgi:hypothetical protein
MAIKVANNQSLTAITALPAAVSGGAMTLLETQTASSSGTISFTSNIDSTYKEYIFKFYDVHPSENATWLSFQVDTGTNTSYNISCVSTWFTAYHNEGDSHNALSYNTSYDQVGTGFQYVTDRTGTDNDQSVVGTLHLYEPSSSTFVKHFMAETMCYEQSDYAAHVLNAGYFNTTTALTRVQFKMNSGDIDAGTIKMYGVS